MYMDIHRSRTMQTCLCYQIGDNGLCNNFNIVPHISHLHNFISICADILIGIDDITNVTEWYGLLHKEHFMSIRHYYLGLQKSTADIITSPQQCFTTIASRPIHIHAAVMNMGMLYAFRFKLKHTHLKCSDGVYYILDGYQWSQLNNGLQWSKWLYIPCINRAITKGFFRDGQS